MTYKVINHSILGELMPVQGPFATAFSENDDYDLALYIDGPVWLVKFEVDYWSSVTGMLETVEKELAVNADYLETHGRGLMTNKVEELFDKVAADQLTFISIDVIKNIRNSIMDLMQEAYDRLDKGETV